MKRINAIQYKKLVKFCKDIFRDRKFITKKQFNLLIQQNLSQMSTRYRRYMLDLELIKEQNRVILPGDLLIHFKLVDYQAMTRLEKSGAVKIYENKKIIFTPSNPDTEFNFPNHWKLESKSRGNLIFMIDNQP